MRHNRAPAAPRSSASVMRSGARGHDPGVQHSLHDPPYPRVAAGGPGARHRPSRHCPVDIRRHASGSHDRTAGQRLSQFLHADPDRNRCQLLRGDGGRGDHGDHLRRHRPVGRLDLRAVRCRDGAGPARRGNAERRGHRAPGSGRVARRGAGLRSDQRPHGRRAPRPSLHHHAGDDVGAARRGVRRQRRREHPAAAGADPRRQSVARPRPVALPGPDAGDGRGDRRAGPSI